MGILRRSSVLHTDTIVATAFTPFTPLLDAFPNANFAYSFRKLRSSYTGSAVRIRATDTTESNFGFDTYGNFDVVGAATFIAAHGGGGTIVTWFDQTINGLDVTQATTANEPTYVAYAIKGFAGMSLDGSNDRLQTSSGVQNTVFGSGTQGTSFTVLNQSVGNNGIHSYWSDNGNDGGDRWAPGYSSASNITWDLGNNTNSVGQGEVSVATPGNYQGNPHVLECYRDSGDTQGITVDGSSLVTGSRSVDLTTAGTPNKLTIGDYAASLGLLPFAGFLTEVVWWGTDLGANRTGARNNINSYYGIF